MPKRVKPLYQVDSLCGRKPGSLEGCSQFIKILRLQLQSVSILPIFFYIYGLSFTLYSRFSLITFSQRERSYSVYNWRQLLMDLLHTGLPPLVERQVNVISVYTYYYIYYILREDLDYCVVCQKILTLAELLNEFLHIMRYISYR